jgi:ankyrin repeat protein
LTERDEMIKNDMEIKMPNHYNRNMTIDDLNVQPNESALMKINMFENDPINETKLLIEMGVNPNITEHEYGTALHYAVANENPNTLKYLLSVGANPFIRDSFGETPYDYAMSTVINGNFEIAEILKDAMIRKIQNKQLRRMTRRRVRTMRRLATAKSMLDGNPTYGNPTYGNPTYGNPILHMDYDTMSHLMSNYLR